ncbi:unnamed protein product [Peronospora belbahrii]|uniref:Uncharacterized protein n=1 Tax=Peronospora belbahrii TaxID=622444 RepID=A0AAU9KQU4_9STRA|nr:unnamed protein product [Peronospora belbahrii]
MHLNCPQLTGYVLDDIATTSGAPRNKGFYASMADIDSRDIGDAFMALCATTHECNEHFRSKSLAEFLQGLMTQLDADPRSTCAALITKAAGDKNRDPALNLLRRHLTVLLSIEQRRKIIPPIVHRFCRCGSKDIKGINTLFVEFQYAVLVYNKRRHSV